MTTATSSEEEHRGQRCPGSTLGNFRFRSISAGTVWVQIGQCTCPFVWFSTSAFMASVPHFIRRDSVSKGCANFVKILKNEIALPRYAEKMNQPPTQRIQLTNTPEYRENY